MPAFRLLRRPLRPVFPVLCASLLTTLLAGCDLLGIEPASAQAARREADGRAVGAACRHAGRGLEDCYALNRKADKASVYAGWKEMSDYMRENQVPEATPTVTAAATGGALGAAPAPSTAPAADRPAEPGNSPAKR